MYSAPIEEANLCEAVGPRRVSALRLSYPIRSDYPFSHAAHPRPASDGRRNDGLGLSVAWIGPPPSVDGSINCIEQSHFLPLILSLYSLFLVACQRSLEREMMAVEAI